MGCGRLFEGSPQQMWESLSKLLALGAPRSTRVYCAHEYTQSNARFAVTVDPSNEKLLRRKQQVRPASARLQPPLARCCPLAAFRTRLLTWPSVCD